MQNSEKNSRSKVARQRRMNKLLKDLGPAALQRAFKGAGQPTIHICTPYSMLIGDPQERYLRNR